MSAATDEAAVFLLLADHAAADSSGKLNLLGGNIQVIHRDANTGATLPFGLVVIVDFPPGLVGEAPAVEIALRHGGTGELVTMPGMGGPQGDAQPIRVGSAQALEEPQFPGQNVPRRTFGPRVQFVLGFANGLPLAAGTTYKWVVSIDGESKDAWSTIFHVPGPPAGPVFG